MSQATIDQALLDADQAEFDADMTYLHDLVAAIEDQAARTGQMPSFPGSVISGELQPDEIFDLVYCPSIVWEHDHAADMLAAWRGPITHYSQCLCGSTMEIRGELDTEDYDAIADFDYAHQDCADEVEAVAL